MTVEDMLNESERLARSGAKQAKKLGLKPKDVNRFIHDFRAQK